MVTILFFLEGGRKVKFLIAKVKFLIVGIRLKPATHERKQLSKWPGKAVYSAVSSRVRRSFRENFATQVRDENICHVWYFWPRKADSFPETCESGSPKLIN